MHAEIENGKIVHTGITKHPTDEWTAQQLREATPWGKGSKYLILDRDKKYGTRFSAMALGSGIKEVKTPYRTPQANGICEGFIGSLRRDCIDHVLIHGDKHLGRIVTEYTAYFNGERPHQGLISAFLITMICQNPSRPTARSYRRRSLVDCITDMIGRRICTKADHCTPKPGDKVRLFSLT